jgi:hypothetical protein
MSQYLVSCETKVGRNNKTKLELVGNTVTLHQTSWEYPDPDLDPEDPYEEVEVETQISITLDPTALLDLSRIFAHLAKTISEARLEALINPPD